MKKMILTIAIICFSSLLLNTGFVVADAKDDRDKERGQKEFERAQERWEKEKDRDDEREERRREREEEQEERRREAEESRNQ